METLKKKLPIGIENFEDIIKENFYYVDKTRFISELLHNWDAVNLFTRPRRFGKSLNMSMLENFFSPEGDKRIFAGALGMAAVFCGATNCPLSSIFLAYELFGGEGLPLYALCCGVSYMLSGYYGLYSEQRIIYSKFRTEWVDRKAGS